MFGTVGESNRAQARQGCFLTVLVLLRDFPPLGLRVTRRGWRAGQHLLMLHVDQSVPWLQATRRQWPDDWGQE